MMTMTRKIARLWRDEAGQGLAEYALILGLVALAVVGALSAVGPQAAGFYEELLTKFPSP